MHDRRTVGQLRRLMRWLEAFKACFGQRAQELALRRYVQGLLSDSDIEPQPGLVVHPAIYPESQEYYFEPLDERVPVYETAFRLIQDLNLEVSSETRELSSAPDASLRIAGAVRYQACDAKICYPPQSIPVSWTLRLKPLER